jgi:NAD-dependent dihydropyrimidine dehydrogenase PreA subunit
MLTVVISQGQSAQPAKRRLEEEIVAGLLFERGVEVTVVPHLYDLTPDGTGMLCLQGITGDVVVVSWLFSRAAFWTLDRNGIRGREGTTLLVNESEEDDEDESAGDSEAKDDKPRVLATRDTPKRTIWCLDLKARDSAKAFIDEIIRIKTEQSIKPVSILGMFGGSPTPAQQQRFINPTNTTGGIGPDGALNGSLPPPSEVAPPQSSQPTIVAEDPARRWYPVIDYSRCTNCMECIDFCLFGVYGVDKVETILVEQPDNCRKGCPACSRVCPENAIIFPQHKSPAIAGSPEGEAGSFKIDLSKLFGAPNALEQAALERDVELTAVGRDAVGMSVGIPKRQNEKSNGPKDDLDRLMDSLDELDL